MQNDAAYVSHTPGARSRFLLTVAATVAFIVVLRSGFNQARTIAPDRCELAFVVSMTLLTLWVLALGAAQLRRGFLVWRQGRSPYDGERILLATKVKEGLSARLDAAGNFVSSLALFWLAGWLVWAIAGVVWA